MDRSAASEEEYIKRQEADTRRDQEHERERQKALTQQLERDRAIALQLRRCPQCRTVLALQTRHGVEIERCNSCNGLWLDAGKLERIMQAERGLVQRIRRVFRFS